MEGPPGRCQSVPSALAGGYPLAQGLGNAAAPSLRRGEPRPTDMPVEDRQVQARGRVAGADGFGAGQIHQAQKESPACARVAARCVPISRRVRRLSRLWAKAPACAGAGWGQPCNVLTPISPSSRAFIAATAETAPAAVVK